MPILYLFIQLKLSLDVLSGVGYTDLNAPSYASSYYALQRLNTKYNFYTFI